MLVVEQNARLALSVADYAFVLRNGQVEAQGTADEVRAVEAVQRAYLGVA